MLVLCCALRASGADSVVVFNEVHYHPAGTNEAAREWVEVQNQMAVDIDLSRWQLARDVSFSFPPGTVLPAGGFLVIAAAPAEMVASGVTNVVGPFVGRLGNAGGAVELRDNNDRVMDRLNYGTEDPWPVAADGAGPSLSRRGMNVATAEAANWCASREMGGTPGRLNFPVGPLMQTNLVVPFGASWRYHDSGEDPGQGWRLPGFEDAGWPEGDGVFYNTSAELPQPKKTLLRNGPITHYFRSRFVAGSLPEGSSLGLQLLVDDGAVGYLNGTELFRVNMPAGEVDAATLANGSVGDAGLTTVDVAVPAAWLKGTNVVAVEVHQGSTSGNYAGTVLQSGPVGYWRLGEESGPAIDLANSPALPAAGSQDGVFQAFSTGTLGQAGPRPQDQVGSRGLMGFEPGNAAPKFSEVTSGVYPVVLVPDTGAFNFAATRRFSLEAWVNGGGSQKSGAAIVCKGTGGGGEQYSLDVYDGVYRFFAWDGNGSPAVAQASVGPNGTWQHVAAVYDQAAGLMKVYLNGQEVATSTPRATLVDQNHPVSIGARQLSSGPYDLNFEGRIDEVAIYDRPLPAAEVGAHFQAAFVGGTTGPDTNDVVFGMELASKAPVSSGTGAVVFNEVGSATNDPFWLELVNTSASEVELSELTLAQLGGSTNHQSGLPSGPLAPGELRVITEAELGFAADPGDRLVLYGAGGSNVLDAVVAKRTPRARFPDGTGEWLGPEPVTPGTTNQVRLHDELVVNELMFAPAKAPAPVPGRGGGWVEIYNRSDHAVDLGGWQMGGGIDYTFAAGNSIGPKAYFVLAEDPDAMRVLYPGVEVFGPFTNRLSKSGEELVLKDAAGNPACRVRYCAGGRWSEYAAGGGSSLELRDPRADVGAPDSWRASDETGKSEWETLTWRGIAQPGLPSEPDLWHEFAFCLLDGAGEVLVDDVSVVEAPGTTASRELIQNGKFNGGTAAHWRFLGTHRHSRVERDPSDSGNYVLHLVATGYGEYQGNQIETTLTNNTAIRNGVEYEISMRVRWLAGKSLLNARLYFNRLARTSQLTVPGKNGTPGRANSRYVPNAGPSFRALRHSPVVPTSGQAVSITAQISDPDGVAAARVLYAVKGGAWKSAEMSGTGREFVGAIPAQAAGSVVQFYVEALDGLGAPGLSPAGGVASRALYRVQDGGGTGQNLPTFSVITTAEDATFLHTGTNALSNELLGCTVVDRDTAYYDAGVRLKGSFVGRNVARVGFHVQFQPDQLFRGIHDKVSIDRSQHTITGGVAEQLVKQLALHAGGIPSMYDDLAWFTAPVASYNSTAALRLAGFDDLYLDSQFVNGGDGTMYEAEVIRWNLQTVDGNPESPKQVGNESGGTGFQTYDLANYGGEKESYRWIDLTVNNRSMDDYTGPVAMGELFGLSGAAFNEQAGKVLDVDEWCRVLAFQSLIGPGDAYYTGGTYHNYRLYRRPQDGRMLYLPWDWDSCFTAGATAPLFGSGNVTRLFASAHWNRVYLNHLYDLIDSSFNTSYAQRWAAHYGTVSGQDFQGVVNYIGSRASYVRAQLPLSSSFAVTVPTQGAVTNGTLQLRGTAPINVSEIAVNGIVRPMTWTSSTQWTLAVPLLAGVNELEVRGFTAQGSWLTNALTVLRVTNTGPGALQPVVINEWMAENKGPAGVRNPVTGLYSDWFELYNPNATAVSLGGHFLADALTNPTLWRIPDGVYLGGHGFLVVWADSNVDLNPATGGTNVDLHAGFGLSKDGESIGLYAPDGMTVLSSVSFGAQTQNVSEGLFPDGQAGAPFTMANWTPGAPNTLAALSQPAIVSISQAAGHLSLLCETIPGRTYELQVTGSLNPPTWTPTTPRTLGQAETTSLWFSATPAGEGSGYYRVVLLP